MAPRLCSMPEGTPATGRVRTLVAPSVAEGGDKLLLHVCCGPCSTVVVPAWRAEGFAVRALFHNPNIAPQIEYGRRLEAMQTLARALSLPLEEPLGGADAYPAPRSICAPDRCRDCIGQRLDATAARAAALGVPRFATSLALSPYQPHDIIRSAGEAAADRHGVELLYVDQRALFGRHYEECRRLGLYRQSYCGCVPSKWEAWHQRRARKLRRAG